MPECNFTEKLSNQEFKLFRKRVIGLILATDMAKHAADLSQLKTTLAEFDIKEGHNVEMLVKTTNEN